MRLIDVDECLDFIKKNISEKKSLEINTFIELYEAVEKSKQEEEMRDRITKGILS